MRHPLAIAVVAVALIAPLAACTSFTFRQTGKGSAPAELQDRSNMIKIPAGTFEMGAQNAEPDEYPPHKVELRGFLIDKTEVTVGNYQGCVAARVCRPAAMVIHRSTQASRNCSGSNLARARMRA